jgi:hypothetical protein
MNTASTATNLEFISAELHGKIINTYAAATANISELLAAVQNLTARAKAKVRPMRVHNLMIVRFIK